MCFVCFGKIPTIFPPFPTISHHFPPYRKHKSGIFLVAYFTRFSKFLWDLWVHNSTAQCRVYVIHMTDVDMSWYCFWMYIIVRVLNSTDGSCVLAVVDHFHLIDVPNHTSYYLYCFLLLDELQWRYPKQMNWGNEYFGYQFLSSPSWPLGRIG